MIPAIKGTSSLSFGLNELKTARDTYSQRLKEVKEIQLKAEPPKKDERILDIKA